jgi:hypothetical protein
MGAEKFAAFNEGGQCIVSPPSELAGLLGNQ